MITLILAIALASSLPNPSFELGEGNRPKGWRLSGGEGLWEAEGRGGGRCVSVVGSGLDSNKWISELIGLEPGALYRLSFWARWEREGGGGCVVAGLTAQVGSDGETVELNVNRDFSVESDWCRRSFIFLVPPKLEKGAIYLGQWHIRGKVCFDDVSLERVEPVHLEADGRRLGAEEAISDGVYRFMSAWNALWSNYSPALIDFTSGFNTNRWTLSEGRYIVYRHSPGRPQASATVRVTLYWYQNGSLIVEASRDGREWSKAGELQGNGEHEVELPEELFPADEIFVRLRSTGSMQVTSYAYEARITDGTVQLMGATVPLTIETSPPDSLRPRLSLIDMRPGELKFSLGLENRSDRPRRLKATVRVADKVERSLVESIALPPNGKTSETLPVLIRSWGDHPLEIALTEGDRLIYRASTTIHLPALHASDYGELLTAEGDLRVWWCGSTYKVSIERPLPERKGEAVRISAARNEYEPFQLVIRPRREIKGVEVEVSDLIGPGGARIGAENVEIKKVEYVKVARPTDSFGCVGWWPDPLPPLRSPFDAPPDRNTPLWITVYVPKDVPAGDYEGEVTIRSSDGLKLSVPLKLHVYDFTLPDETHTRTAYGVYVNRLFHGIKTDEEEMKVFDLYMEDCRKHRISPYYPWPRPASPKWRVIGPEDEVDNGKLRLVCNRFNGDFFEIWFEGRRVGSIKATLSQFEREGVGWQGKGVGWPSAEYIESVDYEVKGPDRCVVRIRAVRRSSSDANRRFEAIYRFDIPPGASWFVVKCLSIRNADSIPWKLNGFYYLIPPAMGGYEAVNRGRVGAWLWAEEGLAFGAVALGDGVEMRLREGHGDVYRDVGVPLKPGEEYIDEGPAVAIFACRAGTPQELLRAAESIAQEASAYLKGERGFEGRISYSSSDEVRVEFDLEGFDRAMRRYIDGFKFNGFNAAGLFRAIPRSIGPYERFTPEFEEIYRKVARELEDHLRERGWLDEAYFYWFDEPSEEDYPFVIKGMELLKRVAPGVKRLLTEQPEPPLYGHVDIWVPVLNMFDPERAEERQRAGEEVWWYVCCGPRAPYPNNFIDHPAICHRIRFWAAEKYGVQGSLYWSTTYWASFGKPRNPWKDPASYSPTGTFWGNGDGFLLYPPRREIPSEPVIEGPVDSIRWELIREGLEDREYFFILRELLREAEGKAGEDVLREAREALKLPDELVRSLTDFTTDPEELFKARERVARAIERLKSHLEGS